MADIKTHYRELSFALKISSLIKGKSITQNFNNPLEFYNLCNSLIDNDISIAQNILNTELSKFNMESIFNGFKLADSIFNSKHFTFHNSDKILWVGADTQKETLSDVIVGNYEFSLKEDSFILENMGLYKYISLLTNQQKKRGIHIFNDFAQKEYNEWFIYTWKYLIDYLEKHNQYIYTKKHETSTIYKKNNNIYIEYTNSKKPQKNKTNLVPTKISTWNEYFKATLSLIREKGFAKWISEHISTDKTYNELKLRCSEIAGNNLVQFILYNFDTTNLKRFFQIYNKEYYYAKSTKTETSVFLVPSSLSFDDTFKVKEIKYSVPKSQLNIITTVENIKTHVELTFRNECRFSHGQFNGTPEAKMYYDKNSDLSKLYIPIIRK